MSNTIETTNQANPVISVAVSKLEKSPLNARKTVDKEASAELKASILAHGLMQNLVVTEGKKGRYFVIAGARRLAALKDLQAEGKLSAEHEVLCQVVSEEHALELSTAENTVRAAMHPADEFEAYARMHKEGKSAAFIAERFGVDEKHVLKRLRLGKVAPELLAEYRSEKLSLENLMAFTMTDNHERQKQVYKSLGEWDRKNNSGHDIRRFLTETMVSSDTALVKFVGLEEYTKAGGTTKTDLFKETVYLENPDLLRELAEQKMTAAGEALKAEGWAWVQIAEKKDWDLINRCEELEPQPLEAPQELLDQKSAIEAELEVIEQEWEEADADDDDLLDSIGEKRGNAEDRLEAVEEQLASFVAYTPDQIAASGCYLYIGHDGKLVIEKGLVKPEDKKASAKAGANESGDADDMEHQEPEKKGFSESLRRDLAAYRLGAAQAEIAKHPALAFDLLTFKAAKGLLSRRTVFDGPNVSFHQEHCGMASKDASDFIRQQMEVIRQTLPLEWTDEDGEAAQFAAFQKLTDYQKQALLAFCVASTLQPKLAEEGKPQTAYDVAMAQTGANVADYWRPTATNFLSRINSAQLLSLMAEIFGENFAASRKGAKKAALVSELERGFQQPEKALDPEKVRKLGSWLPAGMAFGQAEPPQEAAKPKKGRKKAA